MLGVGRGRALPLVQQRDGGRRVGERILDLKREISGKRISIICANPGVLQGEPEFGDSCAVGQRGVPDEASHPVMRSRLVRGIQCVCTHNGGVIRRVMGAIDCGALPGFAR
jgi:hypothetical protein